MVPRSTRDCYADARPQRSGCLACCVAVSPSTVPPARACVHRAWYRARLEAAVLMRGCGAWAVWAV
eukprot:6968845-Prymnesium_polylepis.1